MKHKLLIISSLLLGAVGAQPALAQSDTTQLSPTEQLPMTPQDQPAVDRDAAPVPDQAPMSDQAPMPAEQAPAIEQQAPPAYEPPAALEPAPSSWSSTQAQPVNRHDQPLTRSEVIAETRRALRAGEIPLGQASTTPALELRKQQEAAQPAKTREEVVAELAQARAHGEYPDQGEARANEMVR